MLILKAAIRARGESLEGTADMTCPKDLKKKQGVIVPERLFSIRLGHKKQTIFFFFLREIGCLVRI